ncbi:MAG: hypothetical protein JWQ38_3163 [Flavipsychrobacter sp.]|nr:hypothetical protein [Flavipsychrobacter sp.]
MGGKDIYLCSGSKKAICESSEKGAYFKRDGFKYMLNRALYVSVQNTLCSTNNKYLSLL